jgi:hypothetical protein
MQDYFVLFVRNGCPQSPAARPNARQRSLGRGLSFIIAIERPADERRALRVDAGRLGLIAPKDHSHSLRPSSNI